MSAPMDIVTGSSDMINIFSGTNNSGVRQIPIMVRPAGTQNQVVCDVEYSKEMLERFPFWFFGPYQTLFFGTDLKRVEFYLDAMFKHNLPEIYKIKQTIPEIMADFKKIIVPNDTELRNKPWSTKDITNHTITSLVDLHLNVEQVNNYKFNQFPITKDVPYYLMYTSAPSSTNNLMKDFSIKFTIYYNYFSMLLEAFFMNTPKAPGVPPAMIMTASGAFADSDSKSILANGISPTTDEESQKIYANPEYKTYARCKLTTGPLSLQIFNLSEGGIKESVQIFDAKNYTFLSNYVEIFYDKSRGVKIPTPEKELITITKKIIRRNKLEIIAIILEEVDIPSDSDRDTFIRILDILKDRTRSDRFIILHYLLSLKYN